MIFRACSVPDTVLLLVGSLLDEVVILVTLVAMLSAYSTYRRFESECYRFDDVGRFFWDFIDGVAWPVGCYQVE